MNNFRNVNDDILKDWLDFREQTELAFINRENILSCLMRFVKKY